MVNMTIAVFIIAIFIHHPCAPVCLCAVCWCCVSEAGVRQGPSQGVRAAFVRWTRIRHCAVHSAIQILNLLICIETKTTALTLNRRNEARLSQYRAVQ